MLTPSFRSILVVGALVIVGLIQAGCGGAGKDGSSQAVKGNGFSFEAPGGWEVARTGRRVSAGGGGPALVSVDVIPLVRPYRPSLFTRVTAELDRVARDVAKGLAKRCDCDATVTASRTVTVDGMRARQYDLRYGDLVQEQTFVLDDRREYLLTCRRKVNADRDACALLTASFRLT